MFCLSLTAVLKALGFQGSHLAPVPRMPFVYVPRCVSVLEKQSFRPVKTECFSKQSFWKKMGKCSSHGGIGGLLSQDIV